MSTVELPDRYTEVKVIRYARQIRDGELVGHKRRVETHTAAVYRKGPRCPALLAHMRPDEVAETQPCGDEVYRYLWNVLVPLLSDRDPSLLEDSGPEPASGGHSMKGLWRYIPPTIKRGLCGVAEDAER